MKQDAKSDKPFTLNSHVLEGVNKWEAQVSGQNKNVYRFTLRGKNVYVCTVKCKKCKIYSKIIKTA